MELYLNNTLYMFCALEILIIYQYNFFVILFRYFKSLLLLA